MTMKIGTVLLLAQESGAHEREGIDLILPAAAELIWGAICFAIVFLVLSKLAFPRLRDAIKSRQQAIQDDKESAEKSRREADKLAEEHKKRMADARAESNRIIEEARQQAEQVRKDLIAKAESDAREVVARAQEQIEAERNRTVQELRGTIADMSIELAEKVVGRSIDGEAQRDLVDAYISEVSSMSGNGTTAA
jgi:F-type H+-transporting ATPase subunit b